MFFYRSKHYLIYEMDILHQKQMQNIGKTELWIGSVWKIFELMGTCFQRRCKKSVKQL